MSLFLVEWNYTGWYTVSKGGNCICSFQRFILLPVDAFLFKGIRLAKSHNFHHYVFSENEKFSVFSVSFIMHEKQYIALNESVKDVHQLKNKSDQSIICPLPTHTPNLKNPVLLHTHTFMQSRVKRSNSQFSISPSVFSLFFILAQPCSLPFSEFHQV